MSKTKRAVYIVEDKNTAQYRYRVQNVIDALEESKKWDCSYYLKSELSKIKENEINLIIIARQTAKDNKIINLIKVARKNNIKVLFDLDDLIFSYRDVKLVRKTTREKSVLYWMAYIWGIRRIAKRVDGFICTNEFLAEKLKHSFNKPARVIRNSLNREQVETSEKWVRKKVERDQTKKAIEKPKEFSIGYFSGSPTHVRDFQLVEGDLMKFLENHDDVLLKVVGYMEFSGRMRKMVEARRIEIVGVVGYLRLQGLISKVDINIAPLVINDFTNCKSELKFFEAAAVETTTIASPTFTFKNSITDGINGFLAKPGEWYDKLEYLYNKPEENRKIAKKAREYALKHYYGKEFLKEVEEAYGCFID